MDNPFPQFPKTRPPLPEAYVSVYKEQYINNRQGRSAASGLAQKIESWLHKMAATDVESFHQKKTLEIGAGTLNQLNYEKSDHYDIVEPFKDLYINSPNLGFVRKIYPDIKEINLSEKYHRICSIAAFEHIQDLPLVVAKSCLHLEQGGLMRSCIPNEGSFLWKLGWKMTTGLEFRIKYKLDYGVLMRHEHLNTADEIEAVLKYFFAENSCRIFGLSRQLSLYRFYVSKHPKLDKAREYLSKLINVP